jgi:hypothetical protein
MDTTIEQWGLQPVSKQWLSKDVPVETNMQNNRRMVFSSVESQPVKRRPGGWCEMAASLVSS